MQLSQSPVAIDIPDVWLALFEIVDAASAGALWPLDAGDVSVS